MFLGRFRSGISADLPSVFESYPLLELFGYDPDVVRRLPFSTIARGNLHATLQLGANVLVAIQGFTIGLHTLGDPIGAITVGVIAGLLWWAAVRALIAGGHAPIDWNQVQVKIWRPSPERFIILLLFATISSQPLAVALASAMFTDDQLVFLAMYQFAWGHSWLSIFVTLLLSAALTAPIAFASYFALRDDVWIEAYQLVAWDNAHRLVTTQWATNQEFINQEIRHSLRSSWPRLAEFWRPAPWRRRRWLATPTAEASDAGVFVEGPFGVPTTRGMVARMVEGVIVPLPEADEGEPYYCESPDVPAVFRDMMGSTVEAAEMRLESMNRWEQAIVWWFAETASHLNLRSAGVSRHCTTLLIAGRPYQNLSRLATHLAAAAPP
jgi:hypothetical protein